MPVPLQNPQDKEEYHTHTTSLSNTFGKIF